MACSKLLKLFEVRKLSIATQGCVSSITRLDQRDHWCQWFLRSTSVWDAFRKHIPDLPACTEIVCMNVLKEQQKNNFGTKTILTNLRSRIQANNKNKKQTNQIKSDIAFSNINICFYWNSVARRNLVNGKCLGVYSHQESLIVHLLWFRPKPKNYTL